MKNSDKKKPLTAEQKLECEKLRAIWDAKKDELDLTQQKVGEEFKKEGGGISQGAVGHYLSGRSALNLRAAVIFARLLNVKVSEFSPRLAEELGGPVESVTDDDDLPPGMVTIPSKKIKLIATVEEEGYIVDYEDDKDVVPLYYRKDWLDKKGYRVSALHTRGIKGSSMEPALYEGDRVLINRDMRTPKHGRTFEVIVDGHPCVKRLKRVGATWWVTSDNPAHSHTDCQLENLEQVRGMVVERVSEHI